MQCCACSVISFTVPIIVGGHQGQVAKFSINATEQYVSFEYAFPFYLLLHNYGYIPCNMINNVLFLTFSKADLRTFYKLLTAVK
jgi:hypothetical protein